MSNPDGQPPTNGQPPPTQNNNNNNNNQQVSVATAQDAASGGVIGQKNPAGLGQSGGAIQQGSHADIGASVMVQGQNGMMVMGQQPMECQNIGMVAGGGGQAYSMPPQGSMMGQQQHLQANMQMFSQLFFQPTLEQNDKILQTQQEMLKQRHVLFQTAAQAFGVNQPTTPMTMMASPHNPTANGTMQTNGSHNNYMQPTASPQYVNQKDLQLFTLEPELDLEKVGLQNPSTEQERRWNDGYQNLVKFRQEYGTSDAPEKNSGPLGKFVSNQRRSKKNTTKKTNKKKKQLTTHIKQQEKWKLLESVDFNYTPSQNKTFKDHNADFGRFLDEFTIQKNNGSLQQRIINPKYIGEMDGRRCFLFDYPKDSYVAVWVDRLCRECLGRKDLNSDDHPLEWKWRSRLLAIDFDKFLKPVLGQESDADVTSVPRAPNAAVAAAPGAPNVAMAPSAGAPNIALPPLRGAPNAVLEPVAGAPNLNASVAAIPAGATNVAVTAAPGGAPNVAASLGNDENAAPPQVGVAVATVGAGEVSQAHTCTAANNATTHNNPIETTARTAAATGGAPATQNANEVSPLEQPEARRASAKQRYKEWIKMFAPEEETDAATIAPEQGSSNENGTQQQQQQDVNANNNNYNLLRSKRRRKNYL